MDTLELSKYIGQEANLKTDGLLVRVKIVNAKCTYGRDRFQVTPVTGHGLAWFELARFSFGEAL